jgi:hypothetical protein
VALDTADAFVDVLRRANGRRADSRDSFISESKRPQHIDPGKIPLGSVSETCYCGTAFVALVTPLDSIEGAASSHLQPLLLYGWRRSRSTNSLKKKEVHQ